MDENIKKDAESMRKAMKGVGTDEDTLIYIASRRNFTQRIKIREVYKTLFGRDLMDDLKSELSGDFQKTMLALFTDPVEYDVDTLYKSMKGAGTDDDTLIEVIASRPDYYLKKIKEKYKEKYKVTLEDDVSGDTSFNYKKLLISLLQCNRQYNQNPDIEKCAKIAQELYKAGEDKIGTDEPIFNKYFTICSPAELAVVAREYNKISKNTLYKAIDKEFSGDIKKLLQTVLYVKISPSEYFATRINKSVKGAGTNEKLLTRVVVTRCEVDMDIIKKYYQKLYSVDMVEDIKDDTSGNYGKLLVELCKK